MDQPRRGALARGAASFTGAVLACAWFATTALATAVGRPELEARTITSSDGVWRLWTVPTDPLGRGPSDHRMIYGDAVAWEGRLPFTMRDAHVTPDGSVVGIASVHPSAKREHIVAIRIDPSGRARVLAAKERRGPRDPWSELDAAGVTLTVYLDDPTAEDSRSWMIDLAARDPSLRRDDPSDAYVNFEWRCDPMRTAPQPDASAIVDCSAAPIVDLVPTGELVLATASAEARCRYAIG